MTNYEHTKTDTARGGIASWPPYHWIDEPVEPILKDFWEATYDQSDIDNHLRLIKMLSLRKEGMCASDIARTLGANNVGKYLSGKKKSFVTHLRAEHDRLGNPSEGLKWLPLRMKPRGTPDVDWVQVPPQIRSSSDIVAVLDRLTPTEDSFTLMREFGYSSREELILDRANQLHFYVGAMLGDCSKDLRSELRFPSMKVSLTLSMAKPNSRRFNEFTALCANNSLGVRMHRIRDQPPSTSGGMTRDACFRWISPVSPLIAWIFRIVMGYERGELTTYNKMRADWLLDAPRSFKVHFLQGLAESDGWVSPGADEVQIVATPNEDFLEALLTGLTIPYRLDEQKVNIIVFGTEDGLKLPAFSERIHSFYYSNLVTMATAKSFGGPWSIPDWFLDKARPIASQCTTYSQACLEIARQTGYKVTDDTVKKYMKLAS